jgi:hypothetical protein
LFAYDLVIIDPITLTIKNRRRVNSFPYPSPIHDFPERTALIPIDTAHFLAYYGDYRTYKREQRLFKVNYQSLSVEALIQPDDLMGELLNNPPPIVMPSEKNNDILMLGADSLSMPSLNPNSWDTSLVYAPVVYPKIVCYDKNLQKKWSWDIPFSKDYTYHGLNLMLLPDKTHLLLSGSRRDTANYMFDHENHPEQHFNTFAFVAKIDLDAVYRQISTIYTAKTEHSFSISPNPAHSTVRVSIAEKDFTENTSIRLYNLQGQVVYSSTLHKPSIELPIHQLPAGVYIVECGNARQKLIVQK